MTVYYCKDCQSEYSEEEAKEFADRDIETEDELKAAWLGGIECPTCNTELGKRDSEEDLCCSLLFECTTHDSMRHLASFGCKIIF